VILPFTPTWTKVDALPEGFERFDYLFDKDVEKEWKKGYDGLNEGRKTAVRFRWLIRELNNGGLEQYFWNFTGGYTAETIQDLRTIGHEPASIILRDASEKLFGESDAPPETGLRRAAIEASYGTHPFNDDDDAERLATLRGKEDLTNETRALRAHQQQIVVAMVNWMRANAAHFTHIRGLG